jgi:uncharacterized protein (DUF1684 family)
MTDADARLRDEVEAWREGRYERLRQPVGWLTLAGLDWLKPGVNRVGSAPDADVVLSSGPADAGTVVVEGSVVRATGAFELDGRRVEDVPLQTDANQQEPTLLALGDLRLCVIDREGRLAIRSWDTASSRRRAFDGIPHWPVDARWSVVARFEPTPGRVRRVPDVLGGGQDEESPGDLVFEVDGTRCRLQALPGGPDGELWLVFGDATNGHETYGGGRFLYTPPPDPDGTVRVDFNRAYNPPCVFSPYATCPLPWLENRLTVRIEAGEMLVSETE